MLYKPFELIIICIFFFHVYCISQISEENLIYIENFGSNPGNLKMFNYFNKEYNKNEPEPLVVVLHGCSQNANDVAELTGWNKLAELNNFIVLYPQQKFSNNSNLCFNWFKSKDIDKGKGECESIYQMIKYVTENYNIAQNKIYITGLSAGAAMSMALLATHPETFSAGAIFAGTAYRIANNPVTAMNVMFGNRNISNFELAHKVVMQNVEYKGKYPKLIIYQGLNDLIVNHKNADFIISQWSTICKMDTVPDKIETNFKNIKDITRFEYLNSDSVTNIIYYEIKDLGHRLLIKPGKNEDEGGKTGMFGLDIGFHSTYQTALDFGLIK